MPAECIRVVIRTTYPAITSRGKQLGGFTAQFPLLYINGVTMEMMKDGMASESAMYSTIGSMHWEEEGVKFVSHAITLIIASFILAPSMYGSVNHVTV